MKQLVSLIFLLITSIAMADDKLIIKIAEKGTRIVPIDKNSADVREILAMLKKVEKALKSNDLEAVVPYVRNSFGRNPRSEKYIAEDVKHLRPYAKTLPVYIREMEKSENWFRFSGSHISGWIPRKSIDEAARKKNDSMVPVCQFYFDGTFFGWRFVPGMGGEGKKEKESLK